MIRELTFEDLQALVALYEHLHRSDVDLPEPEQVEATWRQLCSSSDHIYYGAESEGVLLASCALTVIPNLTRGCRPYGVIENVVTHADYRRRGLGKAVVSEALNYSWRRDCYKVMLMAGPNSPDVHSFYEALGFDRHAKQAFLARPGLRA